MLETASIMCWTLVGEGWMISKTMTFWLSICGWGGDSVEGWLLMQWPRGSGSPFNRPRRVVVMVSVLESIGTVNLM